MHISLDLIYYMSNKFEKGEIPKGTKTRKLEAQTLLSRTKKDRSIG